jgi:hypothetical protein
MNFFYKRRLSKEEENFSGPYLLFLGMLGLICLLLGLLCTLLKCAQNLWPLLLAATLGCVLTWGWKKSGLILSFLLLSCALVVSIRGGELFWPVVFSISVALSWLLLFLGHKEALSLIAMREETTASLKEMNAEALKHVARLEAAVSRSQMEMVSSLEELKGQLHAAQSHLSSVHSQLEQEEKEKTSWQQRHEQLIVEISSYQRKEKAFQHALEDAQNQLLKQKYAEQEEPVEEKSLQVLQAQYALLKEQFEEKSEIVHQIRKALFSMESQYLTLQKENEEKACGFFPEDAALMDYILKMQEQCEELESEVYALQALVSISLSPAKKTSAPRKQKNKKEAQEDLFLMMHNQIVSTS